MSDPSEEAIAGTSADVTPAQAAIIRQTVEAVLLACANHSAGGSGGDVSRGADPSRAPETSEGGHGKCFFID